jgi:hypothetical protein
MFDRDELGDDPEDDDEQPECCGDCGLPWEECECDEEDEDGG